MVKRRGLTSLIVALALVVLEPAWARDIPLSWPVFDAPPFTITRASNRGTESSTGSAIS